MLGLGKPVTESMGRLDHTSDGQRETGSAALWLCLLGATAVGVVLRAVFVGEQSLGYEEVFTASIVTHANVSGVWDGIKATESTPPLYYLLTWLWVKLAASQSATAVRMVSLLAGSITVPVAFFATRRFTNRRVALAVAWLCAISPELVGYSIYARSYALLVFATTLSVWALGALLERPSPRRWTLWVLAASACLWTHYFTIFFLAGEVIVLFVVLSRARRALLLCVAAVALASAPLWPLFLTQSDASERTAYIAARPLGGRVEEGVRQFAMGANVPSSILEGAGILIVALGILFALAVTNRQRAPRVLSAVALLGAGPPIIAALLGIDDHYLPRNVIGVWICLAPLAAYGLLRLRAAPLLAYSAICIATVIAVQSNWRYQAATDWREASALLQRRAQGDPIAVMPGIESIVPAFYMHRVPLTAPVSTTDLWLAVEPARGAHERALSRVASPPLELWGTQLKPSSEIDYRGFRLIHLHSPTPVTIPPAPANDGPATAPLTELLAP